VNDDNKLKNVYGGTFKARLKIVKSKHGEDGLDNLFQKMIDKGYMGPTKAEDFKIREKYPIKHFIIFLESYEELYGWKSLEEMSIKAPRKKGIVGWFVRWAGTPELLIKKASEYWPNFYDFGRIEGVLVNDKKGILTGHGICKTSPLFCKILTPYFQGVFENLNLTNPKCVHTKCEYRGDDVGEWVLTWE
jgi:hypothetical protein